MLRILKYTIYFMVFATVIYFFQEISAGNIKPQDSIEQFSQNITDKTSQLMQNTYENTMLNFRQTVDRAVQNSEDVMKQAIEE